MTDNITLRQRRKAKTRAELLAVARKMFATGDYHAVKIRDLAKTANRSTGAIFGNFTDKEDLFVAAMGFPPPVDGPLTRAAPMLLEALLGCIPQLELGNGEADHIKAANRAIALAVSPLDGEAWARHLEAIRRRDPHVSDAEQPAALDPSDAAGDL